jgi:hypothetical protein
MRYVFIHQLQDLRVHEHMSACTRQEPDDSGMYLFRNTILILTYENL